MSSGPEKTPESAEAYHFEGFRLDVEDRQLWRGHDRVELNARYLDALILLVRESPKLVEKDRFFEEVWQDVVVSDSALSQCIKELRKALDDDASNPGFIQTVPRHGYRFIGAENANPTEPITSESATSNLTALKWGGASTANVNRATLLALAGTTGGALAGLFGGMLYGFSLSSPEAGIGTLSTLLVLVGINMLMGLAGAAGISTGWALGVLKSGKGSPAVSWMHVLGATLGGMLIGSGVKMLGVDAFNLFFGIAPSGITGGVEGAILGAAIVFGVWLGRGLSFVAEAWRNAAGAGVAGALAGAVIPLTGGNLMGGSLRLLADSFQESRLPEDPFHSLFGSMAVGPASEAILGSVEGLVFAACVAGVISWAERRFA